MQTSTREYSREGYTVWTEYPKGTMNEIEAVVKGTVKERTASAITGMIGMKYNPWLIRVHIIKRVDDGFVTWVNVKDDNIYEFVKFFKEKGRSTMKTFVKRGIDDKKIVITRRHRKSDRQGED